MYSDYIDSLYLYLKWLNIKRERLALGLCSCSKTRPWGLDPMELSVKQNVMTSSVLLKSSTQHSLTQPHSFKFHANKSTGYRLGDSNKNVSS